METLAELHIQSLSECIDDLKAGGVPDCGLSWLSANVPSILEPPAFDSTA